MSNAPQDTGPREHAAARLPDRIAFLGLGLIGGSIAMSLRRAGARARIAAWTPAGNGPSAAARAGIIDDAAATPGAALEGAGLVVLAGPPLAIIEMLDELAGPLRTALAPAAVVTDVASTKVRIVEHAARLDLSFVGGHPMAGREKTGIDAATADLFDDRVWVVVDDGDQGTVSANRRLVFDLAHAAGARVASLPAAMHDAAAAAISHLPLVLSAALVETVEGGETEAGRTATRLLAASGWRDMTRLAWGDPEMGAGILATNPAAVRDRLLRLQAILDGWIYLIEGDAPDAGALQRRLEAARAALERRPAATDPSPRQ